MNNKDDLDELSGLGPFQLLMYGSLQTQNFSARTLADLATAQSEGKRVENSEYLFMIASQNLEILRLLTFIVQSLKDSKEKEESTQQSILTHLSSISYNTEKIVKK